MFFINDQGYAITCRHVAELIPYAEDIAKRYQLYKSDRSALPKSGSFNKKVKELAVKHGFNETALCELLIQFQNTGSFDNITWTLHPSHDLAILKFNNQKNLPLSYARLLSDTSVLKQGKMLCRLGFPFPEFTNYNYDNASETISWTTTGTMATPRFPIDGMITRFLTDGTKNWGIEMSTPGLKGQSGGPLFNQDGIVCGVQSATNSLHLGFDMKNKEVISGGEKIKVTNQPLMLVGHCIHVDVVKEFLDANGITYHVA